MYTDYDVIIIGSGCAGLSTGIYTARAGLSTVIIEKKTMGGEMMNRQLIENYPGFASGVMGPELASAMLEQAANAGSEFESGEITSIQDKGKYKIVKTSDNAFTCKGVIIASGSIPRKLQASGETELAGKGVFYCATCDGPKCAAKPVVVAGAGDSGITEALHLEKLGCSVTVVEMMNQPKASATLLSRAKDNPNIKIILGAKIKGIIGDDWVTGVDIADIASGDNRRLDVSGIYIRIGLTPNTQFLENCLTLSEGKQIPVDENMGTMIPGVYAAGDVRQNSPVQMATAAGDGVCAAMAFGRYISSL
jgi:thioredoxin reductase (NADPH)